MTTTPDPYAQPSAPTAGGGLARAALIVAIVLVAWSALQQVLSYLLPLALISADMGYSAIGPALAAISVVTALIAVAAVVLGALSLSRETGRRASAGAALGIGVAALVSILLGFMLSAVLNVL